MKTSTITERSVIANMRKSLFSSNTQRLSSSHIDHSLGMEKPFPQKAELFLGYALLSKKPPSHYAISFP